MGKKIGVYGGSFDPIHLGHINLAVEIMEAHLLDGVLFCPAFINPHKTRGPHTTPKDRIAMLHLVIKDQPHFGVLESEVLKSGPSYTIDTLCELVKSQNGKADPDHFALIMGSDTVKHFHRWRQPEEIVKLVPLLIGQRAPDLNLDMIQGSPLILEAIRKGMTPTRIMEISSSEIRERFSKKLYCGHLLQGKVLDYILSNHLYSS